jgi:hypothetical protein
LSAVPGSATGDGTRSPGWPCVCPRMPPRARRWRYPLPPAGGHRMGSAERPGQAAKVDVMERFRQGRLPRLLGVRRGSERKVAVDRRKRAAERALKPRTSAIRRRFHRGGSQTTFPAWGLG